MSSNPMSPDHVSPDHAATGQHPPGTARLVTMANQIGRFFAHEGGERAPVSIAQHLEQFWTRKMCAAIVEYLHEGGDGLEALPRAAILRLEHPTTARPD
jgi:formate dehydrogenase subunit delta